MLVKQWSGIQKEISSSKKAGCCKQSNIHPTAYQKKVFYFPRTREDGHTPTCHQVLFDRYQGPHILVNPKGYLTWKSCPSSIDLKNERHGIISAWWAPQSGEGPDGADQLLPPFPFREIAPEAKRSSSVLLTKSANGLHDILLLKSSEGGQSEQYCFPLKLPEKGWKYSKMETLSFIHFKTWTCWADGEPPIISCHWW